jgi:hypothetical protein
MDSSQWFDSAADKLWDVTPSLYDSLGLPKRVNPNALKRSETFIKDGDRGDLCVS